MTRTPLLIAAALMAFAGAAQAESQAQPLDLSLPALTAAPVVAAPVRAEAPAPTPDLANPLDPLAPTAFQATTLSTAVFARTAVDHRFDKRDDLAFGFLCGLQPGHTESGAAAAYGSDPHGRFVGAKFSIAFR